MKFFHRLRHFINDRRQNVYSLWRKWNIRRSLKPEDYIHLLPAQSYPAKWYGSSYGGFYVVPSMLSPESVVLSIGLGKDISFDLSVIKRHNCRVYGFDPTPKSTAWLKTQSLPNLFTWYDVGLGATHTDEAVFFLPDDDRMVSGSLEQHAHMHQHKAVKVKLRTLAEMASLTGHAHIDVLKMDIEGAEYALIPEIMKSGVVIKQLLIEFHDRMYLEGAAKSQKAVEILRSHGFEPIAHSYHFEEITFLNRRH